MFFASDNSGPVHPKVIEALARANEGYAMAYGADAITERAVQRVRALFEAPDAAVWFVATGSAANSLALACLSRPWDAICCSPSAHIYEDECNAPEFYTGGAKLMRIGDVEDKFTAQALAAEFARWPRSVHTPQYGPVSITNVTERGTLYTLPEIRAIADVAHKHYPDLPVYARARNRRHLHQLMDLGASEIRRETFASALDLSRARRHVGGKCSYRHFGE